MEKIVILVLLYLAAGVVVAIAVDRAQMAKPIPYEEFPSMFSLHDLRFVVAILMVFFGPLICLRYLPPWIYHDLKRRWFSGGIVRR